MRDIDLGPLPPRGPDRVGQVELRADSRRRTLFSNPDGAFSELKRAYPNDHFYVVIKSHVQESSRLGRARSRQTRWLVGVRRGDHFMAVRHRKDPERAVLCGVYTALMLGAPSVFVDGAGVCVLSGAEDDWCLYVHDENGEPALTGNSLGDVVRLDRNFQREGWARLAVLDAPFMRARGLDEVEAEFKVRCGVPENMRI